MSSTPETSTLSEQLSQLRGSMQWLVRRSGSELQRARGSYRNPFARDRARVLHCSSFRRLQGKLSWPSLDEGEVMRSRLTHALETAQLARGLLRALEGLHSRSEPWVALLPDPNLLESIAFARELGAAPFGRGGEIMLNCLMHEHGGFETRAQSIRLLARQEPYAEGFGLDPSRRLLLGMLDRPCPWSRLLSPRPRQLPGPGMVPLREHWSPPQGFYDEDQDLVDWVLMPLEGPEADRLLMPRHLATAQQHGHAGPGSLDASLVQLAAGIAQGVHEFEDGLTLGEIAREDWEAIELDRGWAEAVDLGDIDGIGQALFGSSTPARKRSIGTLVNALVVSAEVEPLPGHEEALLAWQVQLLPQAQVFLDGLQALVQRRLYDRAQVQMQEHRGQIVLRELFEACVTTPKRLLRDEALAAYAGAESETAKLRVIADQLAGLSDAHATRLHDKLVNGVG